jgi:hypothetical protein
MSSSRYTGLAGPIPVSRWVCSRSAVTSPNSSSSGGRSWHTRRRMSAMTFWTSSCSLSSSAAVAAGSRSSKVSGPPSCSHDAAQGDAEPRPWCRGCSRTPGPGAGRAGRWRKMSGWPQHAWACFTAFVERRAATTSGTSRPRPIQGHTPRPSGIPPSRRRRTQPAQALARQRLGGARSGRWGPSACTVRRYRPPEDPRLPEIACRRSAARPPGPLGSTPEVCCWGLMRHPGANRAGSWRAACLP